MGAFADLKSKLNGFVVEFQNKVAAALDEHEATHGDPAEQMTPETSDVPEAPSGFTPAMEGDPAENTVTQIPVTEAAENSNGPVQTTDPAAVENIGNPAVVTPKEETVETAGPEATPEGDPNITT